MSGVILRLIALLFPAALLLGGCSSRPDLPGGAAVPVDFSGAWELDYSQSDNISDRYEAMIRKLRREAERRARGNAPQSNAVVSAGASASGEDLYNLARMAEMITDVQLLDISQDETGISVKREGSFALQCEFHGGGMHRLETPLGSELCGWDAHQMVFQVALPEGLRILHRFTLGPEGQRVNIATTLWSRQAGYPFTLNRVYQRYDPESSGIRCKQTLTRGRVCTTESEVP